MKNKTFFPLVSIIIPVYNGEKYIKEAIDSALAQTYKNIEIIVVNDGSIDKTEQICKKYKKQIQYFYKKNGGTSTALNFGINHMKGEYFSWLSHDDKYFPNKLKRQIDELSLLKNKNTIMMTDLDGIDENYNKIYETHYINHIKEYPQRENSMLYPIIYNKTHGCTLLIPKICFDVVGIFDEEQLVAQDFEFFYRIFEKFPHKLIPEILVTARDSSNRQGRRSKSKGSIEYSDLFIKIIKNLTEKDYKMLAPTKLNFYEDMLIFYEDAGYTKAYEYISSLLLKNLQISSYDLVGSKFNGHDLHKYLRKEGVLSNQLVLYKESNDINTYSTDFFVKDATKELIKNKLFYETDIVHFHLIHNILDLNYFPIITRLKPSVISLHDAYFLGGHCVHHFECDNWKRICHDCPYLNELFSIDKDFSSLNFELKKLAIQNSQISVIVASDWMKTRVENSPIWKNKKIYKIPFGINAEEFLPSENEKNIRKELNISKNNMVIMFRADSGSFKGLDLIIKALQEINPKNITLLVVGEKGLLDSLKNNYDIREYGWVKDDEFLISLYQCCNIFLMPSRYETFGLMAIEAMACGKFVLAINSLGSALPETIESPKYGLAVDEKDFGSKLAQLIDDKEGLFELGKKCRDLVLNKYSKEKYIKTIIETYKEVIKNHKLDEDSLLIINQLKKYMPCESKETFLTNNNSKLDETDDVSFLRKYYRQTMPLKIRKKINSYIIFSNNKFIKKIKQKINI